MQEVTAVPHQFHSRIVSKWEKTTVLVRNKRIRKHIPKTLPMTEASLRSLLRKYGMVYVKPDTGTHGKGIFRVKLRKGRRKKFLLRWRLKRKPFRTYKRMYAFLLKKVKNRSYLVQRGVHLLKRDGRAFDFRVVVQRNKNGRFVGSAIAGRLGKAGKIVSNGSQGADILPHIDLLKPHFSKRHIDAKMKRLYRFGIRTAKQLRSEYKDLWEIGMDIGIDTDNRAWLLEVNTRPEYEPFKRLPTREMYDNLMHHWKYAKRKGYRRFK